MLSLDHWIANFEGYLDARIELVKYDLKELMVNIISKSMVFIGMAVFGLVGLICLNFGIAYLLNHLIGNEFSGFFILTGVYFLITLAFYLNKDNQSLKAKIELSLRESMDHKKEEPNSKIDESAN